MNLPIVDLTPVIAESGFELVGAEDSPDEGVTLAAASAPVKSAGVRFNATQRNTPKTARSKSGKSHEHLFNPLKGTDMTMHDQLVRLLKRRWTTPLDALKEAGCLSLSQRCGEMRRAGMKVADKWVDLEGGKRVKAYRLANGGGSNC